VKVTHIEIIIRIFSLKETQGGDRVRKRAYNAITTKGMGTMNLNGGRSKKINIQAEPVSQIMKETPQMGCFPHVTKLKNNTRTSGY
jgi:hypothetical protein